MDVYKVLAFGKGVGVGFLRISFRGRGTKEKYIGVWNLVHEESKRYTHKSRLIVNDDFHSLLACVISLPDCIPTLLIHCELSHKVALELVCSPS